MSDAHRGVHHVTVASDDEGMRLDRWFRRRFPHIGHGKLARLLRTGQIRLDGRRCKPGDRLAPGQTLRLPPLPQQDHDAPAAPRPGWRPSPGELAALAERVLHLDDAVLALDKPTGLAVQGGTATARHLDAMLDGLRFGGERPRLVHRLDRDTSGVLLLARTAPAARALQRSFRERRADKLYWALAAGVPRAREGRIALALAKRGGAGGERVEAVPEGGQRAETGWRLLDSAGRLVCWLQLQPLTGRSHQLRVHLAAIGHPILGDGKYGGKAAFPPGATLARRLHLHARHIRLPHPAGGVLEVAAPLPGELTASWEAFGFAVAGPP